MNQGKAIIFCAPSGAGKTTIVNHIKKEFPTVQFSISATTREKRENENEGKDYYFLTVEDFQNKISEDAFYEWQEVYPGSYYGSLKSEVRRIWSEGNHVIFDLDVIGAKNLKDLLQDQALSIFVKVQSVETLRDRLRNRKTESDESLEVRLDKAVQEMRMADMFDYVLINEDLSKAFREAEDVIRRFINS